MTQSRISPSLPATTATPSSASPRTIQGEQSDNRVLSRARRHLPYLLLLSAGTAFLIVLSLLNHRALGTGYDLGIYDQTVWNLSHGRIWQTTLVYETAGYYDHFEPILVLLVPLYLFWPDVRVLLIVQAITLGLGSLPIYLYAYRRLSQTARWGGELALLIAAAYLFFPALHHANLNDFHEVALLPPLLGFALYGLLVGKRRLTFVFLGLCLLVKEDVAVTALAFGVYILLLNPRGFRRRDGAFIAGFAIMWALLVLYLFYPSLTRGMEYPFVSRRYAWLGDSPESAIRNLIRQPWIVLPHLFQWPKLQFVIRLFAPLLFLPLLGWPVIALALPILGYLMLSSYEPQWSVQSYYNPPLLPILFFSLILVIARAQDRARGSPGRWIGPVLTGAVIASVAVSYFLDAPGPGSRLYDSARFQVDAEKQAAYRLMSRIPDDVAVGTVWWLVPHLSHREQIDVVLDRPENPPEYLLIEDVPYGTESAPTFPYAAPPGWPPIFHEYQLEESAGPYQLVRLARSVPLTPLVEPESLPVPLSLAAFAWLDSPSPEAPPALHPGESTRLVLAWRRTGPLDRRYVFFVHLLDPATLSEDGSPVRVAQNDQEPAGGRFPTTMWESWTLPPIVLDVQNLHIPEELTPGRYELWGGAYEQESLQRVDLGGPGQTLVLIGSLEVVAPDGQ